jgi:signal transduction histidine kinase
MGRKVEDPAAQLETLDADLFAPGLLHELRQPLMGAHAAVALLERLAGSDLGAREEWRMLLGQLQRLSDIVTGYEDLLLPGRVEPTVFDAYPVVARAAALLAHRLRPLAARFALEPRSAAALAFGRPGALVHATTNLLANAVDAVEERGAGRIEVRVLTGDRARVEVRISDEGAGIAAEARPHIFEPRFTTKAPGQGTGLGLYLARRLMAQTGGEVYLVAEDDPVRLPWAITELCVALPGAAGGAA